MTWDCPMCNFSQNEDDQSRCVACGAGQKPKPDTSKPYTISIELPAKEKLGVKLMPPKNGVIQHGLSIDNIDNPLLENKVQAGDLIVAIGGKAVHGLGFSDAIDLIRKLPRPLAISFEIDEKRREKAQRDKSDFVIQNDMDTQLTTYAVVFEEGPMGLNLEEAVRYGIDGAVVKALKGQAKTSGMISVGDIVYKVNETDVLCMPYTEVMNVIRNTPTPRTLQFVPKDKLADVQRVNSRHSESFRMRDSNIVKDKLMKSPRIVKDEGSEDADDHKSIARLILDNQAATIKKGRMYKQGRVMRAWKSRYFILSVSKLEYFKNPSATNARGEMSFLSHRCTVRSLPPTQDVVCKSPAVTAKYLLELRVDDRRLVMACTSESDKKGWMDALKLAIDASKTVGRTQADGSPETDSRALLLQHTASIRADATFLDKNTSGRLSQFSYDAFATPVVHITVVSATNLTKAGSTVNAVCEITLGDETFRTSTVKSQRSPVWQQDNSASFEVPNQEMVIEVRVFDEHVFRSTELMATLTIPLKSLPNMEKTNRKYPLAVGNRSSGAFLSLSLEYINKARAFQQDQERQRMADDLGRLSMLRSGDEMTKLQNEAQMAADEATDIAARAEAEALTLLEQARQKAEAAVAAARAEQEQGKAAVEAAIAEAALAKEEAERQAEEARRAQEEAHKLIEANRRIQEHSSQAQQLQGNSIFANYRKMIMDGQSSESVIETMRNDGIDEINITAFFDGINSYDEKIRALQAEVEKLKRNRSTRPREETKTEDMFAHMDISKDQVKLLRRLLKLEKQLQQAGIAVAADIPYEEAKAKIEEISRRMYEIGSSDVTHPDPLIQKQLREEYYKLEQDMEKYNTALMLTDEFAAEEARKDREWEEENEEENVRALKAIRRMMPVDVKQRSEADLQSMETPRGGKIPREVARKYKRTNVLQLLRMDPAEIAKSHPSLLDNFRVAGLTVTERRALHHHLRGIADVWKTQQSDEMTKKKYDWFRSLKETSKTVLNAYNNHVKQYGPPSNHPYATRDDPDIGCPLIGKQCPIKADMAPPYDLDLGFPEEDVYLETTIQKGSPDDSGARALREAQELARAKVSNSRTDTLKKHYKNVRLVAEAKGACEHIDTMLDTIELRQLHLYQARLKHRLQQSETAATIKLELAEFGDLVNEIRLASFKLAERSGMSMKGKRTATSDGSDTRSSIECNLCIVYCDAVLDCFEGIRERMDEVKASDKRLRSAIPTLEELLREVQERSQKLLSSLADKGPPVNRRFKTRVEIMKEAKEKNAVDSGSVATSSEPSTSTGAGDRPPNPMLAARGRGRGGRGRGDLLSALKGRGGNNDENGDGGQSKGGPPGAGGLFAAIKSRGARGEGEGRGGLLAGIQARGRGGRGNDLMAAIAARRKE